MKIHLLRYYKPLEVIKKAGFLLFFYSLSGNSKKRKSNIKMLKKEGITFSYGKI
jgi:hypothetical protein